jgi:catechol 2,3-dioxygenase-like lactoylglutathione lyase family enzyme
MFGMDTMYVTLPAKNMQEAMDFYGKTLGLHVVDKNENGVWYQSGQSRIALYESEFAGTNKGTAAIWEVADPEATVKSLKGRGVKLERYDNLKGIKRKGDLHYAGAFVAAWFKDPSGNLICITHHL